jgi:hypothetical protein
MIATSNNPDRKHSNEMQQSIEASNNPKPKERSKWQNLTTRQKAGQGWLINLVAVFWGLVMTVALTFGLVTLLQVRVLSCTRLESTQYSCQLKSNLLGLIPLRSTPIIGLQGATVKHEVVESTNEDNNGRSRTTRSTVYWVVLATGQGEVELDIVKDGGSGSKLETAERINAFVRDPAAKSLQVRGDLTHLFWLPLILFFLPIALIVLLAGLKALAADIRSYVRHSYSAQSI